MLDTQAKGEATANHPLTLSGAISQFSNVFRNADIDTAALDARLLVAEAAGLSLEETIVNRDLFLSGAVQERIGAFAARRLAGEPVSRIIGRREFWGLPFGLSPHTLDPRPETELLVETVLAYVRANDLSGRPLRILDLGTGSGCLLGALLSELPLSYGVGLDRSLETLAVARENLRRLGLLHSSAFLCACWADALGDACFDIIVCNPPYIATSEIDGLENEVRMYDPRAALDGGDDGLQAYRLIFGRAFKALRSEGLLVFETGHRQADAVLELMVSAAPSDCPFDARIMRDLGGTERAVAGVRQSSSYKPYNKKKIGNSDCSGYGQLERRPRKDPLQVG
jgi:release factor glutamine methyltransferase